MRPSLIFLALLLAGAVHSQDFNGIGDIRLGMDEQEYITSVKSRDETGYVIVNQKNNIRSRIEWGSVLINKEVPPKVYKLEEGINEMDWPAIVPDSYAGKLSGSKQDASFYYLNHYNVGGLRVNGVFLTFQKGKLQCIEINPVIELLEAAKDKYKPSLLYDTTYKVPCVFVTSGVKEIKTAGEKRVEWRTPTAVVVFHQKLSYSDKCQSVTRSEFSFKTPQFQDYLNTLSSTEQAEKYKSADSLKQSIRSRL